MKDNKKRIQKVLSENGIMSRRKSEIAIKTGKIRLNGYQATLGMKMDPYIDIIHIGKQRVYLDTQSEKIYIMMNKPRGYITTTKDERDRKCVMDLLKDIPHRVYPIGRLDKNSEGLLLFTNDGEFANFIMHPKNNIKKTYRVTIRGDITEEQIIKLTYGVNIDTGITLPANIKIIIQEPNRCVFNITIMEGKNRQIRKMCESIGLNLIRLIRVSIGPVKLGMLQPGKYRYITPEELKLLKKT